MNYNADADGIEGYTDADFGRDVDDRRSTSGYVYTIAGGAVSWSSKKQSTTAVSTQEAEYVAIEHGSKEAIWISRILEFINRPLPSTITINSDNEAAIDAVKDPFKKSSLKHVDIRIHATHDRYARN